ncbi:conserved hypothetical protein [Rhodospirillaceae bacterium LM-1]|nr:conserved hypothetical protein [Rhodospirillaceae bacterium LM-1]
MNIDPTAQLALIVFVSIIVVTVGLLGFIITRKMRK